MRKIGHTIMALVTKNKKAQDSQTRKNGTNRTKEKAPDIAKSSKKSDDKEHEVKLKKIEGRVKNKPSSQESKKNQRTVETTVEEENLLMPKGPESATHLGESKRYGVSAACSSKRIKKSKKDKKVLAEEFTNKAIGTSLIGLQAIFNSELNNVESTEKILTTTFNNSDPSKNRNMTFSYFRSYPHNEGQMDTALLECVVRIRRQRAMAVRTSAEYLFIYMQILHYFLHKEYIQNSQALLSLFDDYGPVHAKQVAREKSKGGISVYGVPNSTQSVTAPANHIFFINFENDVEVEEHIQINETKLLWLDLNLDEPVFLNDTFKEAMRLNEFLGQKSRIYCSNRSVLNEDTDDYYYCWDKELLTQEKGNKKAMYLSGLENTNIYFQKILNITEWNIFLMESNKVVDTLSGDANELNIDSIGTGYFDYGSVIALIANHKFLISKIEPYCDKMDKERNYFKAIEIVDELIGFLNTRILQIQIRLGGDKVGDVIFRWYTLLYEMHVKYNYVVIGANSNGKCGRHLSECEYHVTFLQQKTFASAPIFGLGSCEEERKRLVTFLMKKSNRCAGKLFCNSCASEEINVNLGDDTSPEKLSQLIQQKDCQVVDLKEREWEMMHIIVNNCHLITNLAITIRIYFGEEAEYYRQYYTHLVQLKKCKLVMNVLNVTDSVIFTLALSKQ
uniref:Helicase ATP-binding domain-containing protein n=1 Tax=Rhabditophanes sp. KR3021 TaxID=114890 RepID=A0AC35UGZ2_9BILA